LSSDLRDQLQLAIGNAYRIDRELSSGGVAHVFVAEELSTSRWIVVKTLSSEQASAVNLERFRREILVASRLEHPGIVPLLGAGQSASVVYYMMPYIAGESLRELIEREGQLPLDRAVHIAHEVADALDYAHAQNIVHRDIKPANILIGNDSRVMVVDFGIARAIEQAADIRRVTSTGLTIGTPVYMSPEQGSAERSIDGRSDVYSLGCVLFEMLAGQPPFTGPTAQAIVARHMSAPVPSIRLVRPQVPEGVERVIERALAKVPADRYASAREFADVLANPDTTRPSKPARAVRRRAPLLAITALILVGAAAAAMWSARARSPLTAAADPRRIAVLYFDAPSGDSSLAAMGRWFTRDLIYSLEEVRELAVISEAGIESISRGTRIDSVAARLSVGTVVTGVVEGRGDSIQVDVRLVDASSLVEKGAVRGQYPRAMLLTLRDTVVHDVAREILRKIGAEVQVREWRAGTGSQRAWELRQRAQDLIETEYDVPQGDGSTGPVAAIRSRADSLLALAAAADPHWADPVIERGWIRWRHASYEPNATVAPIIDTGLVLAREALGRRPGDAHAIGLRGSLRYEKWNSVPGAAPALLDSAEADLVAATTADPNFARGWTDLSAVLRQNGDIPGSLLAVRRALAADPYVRNKPMTISRLFFAYLWAGRSDSAKALCAETAPRYPRDPSLGPCELVVLGWAGRGKADIARAWMLVAEMERGGLWPLVARVSPEGRYYAAAVLARSGLADSARAVIADTRRHLVAAGLPEKNLPNEAYVRVLLGEQDAALDALERVGRDDPSALDRAKRFPWFDPLRSLPRFKRLMNE